MKNEDKILYNVIYNTIHDIYLYLSCYIRHQEQCVASSLAIVRYLVHNIIECIELQSRIIIVLYILHLT
jgi:hypothetical protein